MSALRSRQQRSREELVEASKHVAYEAWMLEQTGSVLISGLFGDGPAKNALLESWTIHARALWFFAFADKSMPDDVLAEDFFSDDPQQQWNTLRGDEPPILEVVRRRVGKEIAHLTYARLQVTPEAKHWNIRAITEALSTMMRTFSAAIPRERLCESWPLPTKTKGAAGGGG
jgi:hypothetical protein